VAEGACGGHTHTSAIWFILSYKAYCKKHSDLRMMMLPVRVFRIKCEVWGMPFFLGVSLKHCV